MTFLALSSIQQKYKILYRPGHTRCEQLLKEILCILNCYWAVGDISNTLLPLLLEYKLMMKQHHVEIPERQECMHLAEQVRTPSYTTHSLDLTCFCPVIEIYTILSCHTCRERRLCLGSVVPAPVQLLWFVLEDSEAATEV